MTLAAGTPGRRGWRRWSDLSQVDHVALYTRQSLYVVLAAINTFAVLNAADESAGDAPIAALVVAAVAMTGAGLWTLRALLGPSTVSRAPRRPIELLLAVCAVCAAGAAFAWPEAARNGALGIAAATICISLGVIPDNRVSGALVGGGAVLAGLQSMAVEGVLIGALIATTFVLTGRASMWIFGIVRDLDEARRAQSELAVMEERLRFSRDVHDVLGRRLSTIAVQAELAATLAQRGDATAPERMLEVRGVAHQALREARELARGYRRTNFAQELEGARSLLRSAGIAVHLAVDDLPNGWHEAAGWVVRECVTNVLRHSNATVVEIAFSGDRLRIDNDGARPADGADGAGLAGLRERLEPLGASLTAGSGGDPARWSVLAVLPGSGPLSAMAGAGAAA